MVGTNGNIWSIRSQPNSVYDNIAYVLLDKMKKCKIMGKWTKVCVCTYKEGQKAKEKYDGLLKPHILISVVIRLIC